MLGSLINKDVYFYSSPVDMRKSISGLRIFVSAIMSKDPCDGSLYVFYNKGKDKMKILYWDKNGYCLYYKILSGDRYMLPNMSGNIITINYQQLQWLVDGLDINKVKGYSSKYYGTNY